MENNFLGELFDNIFGESFNKMFGEVDETQTEKLEFKKGDYLTKVELQFNKEGACVVRKISSEYVESEEKRQLKLLNADLSKAIEDQNFEKAAEIRDEIRKLEKPSTIQNQITN